QAGIHVADAELELDRLQEDAEYRTIERVQNVPEREHAKNVVPIPGSELEHELARIRDRAESLLSARSSAAVHPPTIVPVAVRLLYYAGTAREHRAQGEDLMAHVSLHPLWSSLALDRHSSVSLQDQIVNFFRDGIVAGRIQ